MIFLVLKKNIYNKYRSSVHTHKSKLKCVYLEEAEQQLFLKIEQLQMFVNAKRLI